MVRGGYLRKVAAGIYSFLPLGWRVVKKVEKIIREEMDRSGASEVFLPAGHPRRAVEGVGALAELRRPAAALQGPQGRRLRHRPDAREVISALVRGEVRSWRQLPLNLYQIQTKFRDELRPRAGLMRGREFIMKDAYSFHVDVRTRSASTSGCTTPTSASSRAAGCSSAPSRPTPATSAARCRTSSRC
jgi:prolyl-tRNA synthetase